MLIFTRREAYITRSDAYRRIKLGTARAIRVRSISKTHSGGFNTGDFYEIKDDEIKDKILKRCAALCAGSRDARRFGGVRSAFHYSRSEPDQQKQSNSQEQQSRT